jgi:hypothetical protein
VLLVDIGGNQGHDLKLFQDQEPGLPGRLVLMDLPEVVNKITTPLNGIEVIPYDFFTPQPITGFVTPRLSSNCGLTGNARCSLLLLPCNLSRLV